MENSILFPGVHVKSGAEVRNSVLFYDNVVGHGTILDTVVSDVNVTFGARVRIGGAGPPQADKVTVVGWNNHLLDGMVVGSGCTLHPNLRSEQMAGKIGNNEVVR